MHRTLLWTHLLLACWLLVPPAAAAQDVRLVRGGSCCCASDASEAAGPVLRAPRCGTTERSCPCSSPAPRVPRVPETPTVPAQIHAAHAELAAALAHAPVLGLLGGDTRPVTPCATLPPRGTPPVRDLLGVRLL